jgi:hypothetical protein
MPWGIFGIHITKKDVRFKKTCSSEECPPQGTALFGRLCFKKYSRRRGSRKKEQGVSPARKIVSTLFTRNLDLIFVGGATLLVRARAPPETWTTRRWSYDLPAPILVDQIFALVIIFGNECSKLEQITK